MVTDALYQPPDSLSYRWSLALEVFFAWLGRVFMAAVLAGSAWIDDAPPLELAAWLTAGVVVASIVIGFKHFLVVLPFSNPILKTLAAVITLILLFMAFFTVTIFVGSVSSFVVAELNAA